jgi:hypothetical protein
VHFPRFRDGSHGQLFDLIRDPEELTNVYGKPEYRAVARMLHEMLARRERELKVRK